MHPVALTAALAAAVPVMSVFSVNVALRQIGVELGASPGVLQLVVAAYGAVYAALVVIGGRLGNSFSRKRMLMLGLELFAVTSLLCAAAQDPEQLVAARLVQAVPADPGQHPGELRGPPPRPRAGLVRGHGGPGHLAGLPPRRHPGRIRAGLAVGVLDQRPDRAGRRPRGGPVPARDQGPAAHLAGLGRCRAARRHDDAADPAAERGPRHRLAGLDLGLPGAGPGDRGRPDALAAAGAAPRRAAPGAAGAVRLPQRPVRPARRDTGLRRLRRVPVRLRVHRRGPRVHPAADRGEPAAHVAELPRRLSRVGAPSAALRRRRPDRRCPDQCRRVRLARPGRRRVRPGRHHHHRPRGRPDDRGRRRDRAALVAADGRGAQPGPGHLAGLGGGLLLTVMQAGLGFGFAVVGSVYFGLDAAHAFLWTAVVLAGVMVMVDPLTRLLRPRS